MFVLGDLILGLVLCIGHIWVGYFSGHGICIFGITKQFQFQKIGWVVLDHVWYFFASWSCFHNHISLVFGIVDRILIWAPIKKTTQGKPNECQIVYLGITIKLIDRSQVNSVFHKFYEPPPLNRTLNPEQTLNTKQSQKIRRNDPKSFKHKSLKLCKRTHLKAISWSSFTYIENLPTKWGRLRNFGDLNWFVGARQMEDLLNFLIKSWEVWTYIPWYLPDTHAHDPEGIGYHFMGIGQYLNTSSGWNMVTYKMNRLHFWNIFWSIG